ncbi:hypothetical protein [Deinococcus soli (ex Cha et al. 2016)]|uniref:DNA-binding PadR family transcriptional regulator n=2 Tax=Deinococcus soli (ex Cha et al. 2016) TaxID=1309411 RepID=A0AAE3XC80_9DEIO|nr:hypothetical protein [Deinococcus soli (ex Cha et al. 2016)]MDR6218356.1 DNA-binding PadR family transcriptional regulator [Deinococcus soli (ex Cha et al. 2016)]MDR6329096.1 DNA-binding PadR family transcriptional regulator [Deinococcus soli (ex Cha et al. 2016)]MDR6751369.1 DNA-binding PadR family transcriptional regulator [Deinococcus soli (ex Cha et al. 2016)]
MPVNEIFELAGITRKNATRARTRLTDLVNLGLAFAGPPDRFALTDTGAHLAHDLWKIQRKLDALAQDFILTDTHKRLLRGCCGEPTSILQIVYNAGYTRPGYSSHRPAIHDLHHLNFISGTTEARPRYALTHTGEAALDLLFEFRQRLTTPPR